MNIIEAEYEINTPMFLGSACSENAELRPPSFKGVLRFWFRALALSECDGNMSKVEELESRLFGTTRGKNQQKALYSLRIVDDTELIKTNNKEEKEGIIYLGYGLMSYKKKEGNIYNRNHLKIGGTINVILIENKGIRTSISDEEYELGHKLLKESLKCIGLFGALGSRARNGFGSLTLLELKGNNEDEKYNFSFKLGDDIQKEINDILCKSREYGDCINNIKYTAFSKFTKTVITKEYKDPFELLNLIGKEMIRYRSYGRGGKVLNNEKSSELSKKDHDHMYEYIISKKIEKHPERVAFGLPHNYMLTKYDENGEKIYDKNNKEVKIIISINSKNRRSSPLFIHIHKLKEDKYVGILSLIPAEFLNSGDKVKISTQDKDYRELEFEANIENYEVVEGFLNHIKKSIG